jgi:hypothetical protein
MAGTPGDGEQKNNPPSLKLRRAKGISNFEVRRKERIPQGRYTSRGKV